MVLLLGRAAFQTPEASNELKTEGELAVPAAGIGGGGGGGGGGGEEVEELEVWGSNSSSNVSIIRGGGTHRSML